MPTIKQRFTVIIEKEDNGYVSLCPELDIASQGDSIEEAKDNLKEAIELFLELASPPEIKNRLKSEIFITNLEVSIG
ncbi:type II toxin-antitoxin system HicB family antitoxin [Anabaena sp. PCC 7108]|uniref:type II toxin-antitoxin system HicB family antitoxin n=1 Tax=Anabaena sp. PCC 7108 TaxID=163908 RepID=UPI00034B0155|nr:type II toxin-antitoxin system HicB family antitoxin [Anabaena sp. PCC 7108]